MCAWLRHLPGHCCGVLILLLLLQLIRFVATVPAPEGLPSRPTEGNPARENPTAAANILHRSRGTLTNWPPIRNPAQVKERSSHPYRGTGPRVYNKPRPNRPVKHSAPSSFSLPRQGDSKSEPPTPPPYFFPDPSRPYPLFDHNFLLNLGIPLISETSPDGGETQRNTRSAWNSTSPHTFRHHRVNFQLYSLKAWTLLQLLPNGTVGLSANESDPHTFLKIQPLQMQQPYTIRLRSVATGIYLCMNRQGSLYSSCNRSSECEFLPRIEKTYYTTIESKQYPKRYIAIGADKRIKKARKLRPGKTLIEDHFFLAYKKNLKATDLILRKVFPAGHGPLQHCADFTPIFAKDREIVRHIPTPQTPSPTTTTPTTTTTTTTTTVAPPLPRNEDSLDATSHNKYDGNSVSYSTKQKGERHPHRSQHPKKKSQKCQENRRKCRRRKCKSEKCREKRRKRRRRRKEKIKSLESEESKTKKDNVNPFRSSITSNINNNNNNKNSNVNVKENNVNNDIVNVKNTSIISSYKNDLEPYASSGSLSGTQDSWRRGPSPESSLSLPPPPHRTRHKHGQLPALRTKGKNYFYTEAPVAHTHDVHSGSSSTSGRSRIANKVVQSPLWTTLTPSTVVAPSVAPSLVRMQQWSDSFVRMSHYKEGAPVVEPIKPSLPARRIISTQRPFRSTPSSSSNATTRPNTTAAHALRNVHGRNNRISGKRPRGRNAVIKR